MRFNNSSWFPLKNFTKDEIDADWMLGTNSWGSKLKDALTGMRLKSLETCLWNRRMGNLTVSLQGLLSASKDPKMKDKIISLKLPFNVKV